MYTKLFFGISIILVLISGGCRLVVEIGSKRTDNVSVKEKQVVGEPVQTKIPDPPQIETPIQTVQNGRTEAINVYGSEFGPENAFDEDDRLSRWISDNPVQGIFQASWISFTFDTPRRVNAYYLKPECSLGREPEDFILQAWDDIHKQWIDLDARSGIKWNTKSEMTFFFKNTSIHTKYRLYVTKVNGSDVVSIVAFRMGYMEPFGQN